MRRRLPRTRPPRLLDDRAAAVMLAVINDPHPRLDSIVEATGLGRHLVHHRLSQLRAAGLVDWTDRTHGTIHPLVTEVPFGKVTDA